MRNKKHQKIIRREKWLEVGIHAAKKSGINVNEFVFSIEVWWIWFFSWKVLENIY